MTTTAFIGLGIMGQRMAQNLVTAGFDLVGYNRSRPAVDDFVAAGGRGAASVAEAVADADVIAMVVPDSPDVEGPLREAGVALPLGAVVAPLVGAANAQGYGRLDHSALLTVVEQLSGKAEPARPTASGAT